MTRIAEDLELLKGADSKKIFQDPKTQQRTMVISATGFEFRLIHANAAEEKLREKLEENGYDAYVVFSGNMDIQGPSAEKAWGSVFENWIRLAKKKLLAKKKPMIFAVTLDKPTDLTQTQQIVERINSKEGSPLQFRYGLQNPHAISPNQQRRYSYSHSVVLGYSNMHT